MQSKGKQKWVKKLGYNVGRGWRGDQKWRSNKHNILINHTKAKVCECKAKVLTNKLRHTIINMNCYVIEQIWRIPEVMQHPKLYVFTTYFWPMSPMIMGIGTMLATHHV